ncbi:MAG: Stk1 family PASTA domain-containing Ser/Thr kinase [Cryobacterium sp.]
MSEPPSDPMIGRLLDGRYEVRSRIARGGMATVYLATDVRLERRVALKVMHGHLADDSDFRDRFIQEARSAARLAHPNVVNVFDQGQDADMAYLVMEYLPGITLRDLLKDYGRLTPEQTLDILEAVLSGLAAAHKAGIVHRDVKPENVLLADDGRIKISDFGLARASNNNTATGQALLGTIAYLSPELVTRGVADARSDIYALGIMTFEMLTGEQPYVGDAPMQIAYQHANDTVPVPSSRVASIPEELDELVLWATARDPEQRPRDARVMLDQLLDTGSLMRPAAGAASTMVLPAGGLSSTGAGVAPKTGAVTDLTADAATRAFGGGPLAATIVPDSVDSPGSASAGAKLSGKSRRRKTRGFWLFTLIVLLAAAFAGTGWYFGSGPGSEVSVPVVAGSTLEQASAELSELGLGTSAGSVYSSTVPAGIVIATDPGPGTRVANDADIAVTVSLGLQPITLPPLAGLTRADAEQALTDLTAQVGSTDEVFNADADEGIVLSATTETDGTDVSEGGPYFEGLAVNMVVSLGPIPSVNGRTFDDATAILTERGLLVRSGEESYNDAVPAGSVIRATVPEGVLREGATLTLTISRGPEPVEIPNAVGLGWNEGKQLLLDRGFKLDYQFGADEIALLLKVESTSPAAGSSAPRGSTVTLTPANPFLR